MNQLNKAIELRETGKACSVNVCLETGKQEIYI